MPRAAEIKKGYVVEHAGGVHIVRGIERSAPTARGGGTLFRFRLEAVPGGQRSEVTFKGDEVLREADLVRRQSTFSYQDGDNYVFMDDEDFTQYELRTTDLGESVVYIIDGLTGCYVLLIEGRPVALTLPQSIALEVAETAPVMKGATATKSAKPATLETGLEVMVPDYITTGEKVKVNTETGEFMSRA